MAKITIEEYSSIGGNGAVDGAPVPNLKALITTTVDDTTSAAAESIVLDQNTEFVSILCDADHRLSYGTDTTATTYATVTAGAFRDFAVDGGDTIHYRTDA